MAVTSKSAQRTRRHARLRKRVVGTATRPVVLGRVQPAGKKSMAAIDWARGARPGDDEQLG